MRRLKKGILIGVLICLALSVVAVGLVAWRIRCTVGTFCAKAQEAHPHPGDDIEALVTYMNTDSHSFKERNLAVWTLGRIGDKRALPALEVVYTGSTCDHDGFLCQYELEKAITRCGGIPNPPRTKKH